METRIIIVSAIAGFLGTMSIILAFVAEGTKSTLADVIVTSSGCDYIRAPEVGLGVVAVLLLIGAQITVTAASGCCGCCCDMHNITSRPKRTSAIVLSVLSWIMFAVGFSVLIVGASHNHVYSSNDVPACYVTKTGVFSTGAIFSLLAVSLGITSYILFCKSSGKPSTGAQFSQGVGMGQQQFPNVAQPQFPPSIAAAAPANGVSK